MSPRRRTRRVRGCAIKITPQGRLRLTFVWKGVRRFKTTELFDTPENRKQLEEKRDKIGAEIRAGTFDIASWFTDQPKSAPKSQSEPGKKVAGSTIIDSVPVLIDRKKSPAARPSLIRDYESHFKNYFRPSKVLAGLDWKGLTKDHLEDLRVELRGRANPITEKTIKNMIDGTLRALYRMVKGKVAAHALFGELEWEEYHPEDDPDPFTEEERDRLLRYYSEKKWKVSGFNKTSPCYPLYAYLATLFHTGRRPGHVAACRLGDLDLRAATLLIRKSRHLGREFPTPKNKKGGIARLSPELVEILRPLVPLRGNPKDYLFTNQWGEAINVSNFAGSFGDAQRALGLRSRGLYQTKHTYCSIVITKTGDYAWLSEQTGVSVPTLQKHYARWQHTPDRDARVFEKLAAKEPEAATPARMAEDGR